MLVHLGEQEYTFPSQALAQLEDHTALHQREDWQALRSELERLGYLRIKQLHNREQVVTARTGHSPYFSCPRTKQKYFSCHEIQKHFSCPGI